MLRTLTIISLLAMLFLYAQGCSPAGRRATYTGIYVCGYPTHFMPDAYPGEGWYLTDMRDTTWEAQIVAAVKADTHRVIQDALAKGHLAMLYEPIQLGGYGCNLRMELVGIPSHKYRYGFGPHGCCERTFAVHKLKSVTLDWAK